MLKPVSSAFLAVLLVSTFAMTRSDSAETSSLLVPANFVSLTERGASGKEITISSPSPLVDRNSEIQIRIEQSVLDEAIDITKLREEWVAFVASEQYREAKAQYQKYEAKLQEADVKSKEAEAEFKEAEARFKEAETKFKEDEAKLQEAEAKFKGAKAQFEKAKQDVENDKQMSETADKKFTRIVEGFLLQRPHFSIQITATVHPKDGKPYDVPVPGYTSVDVDIKPSPEDSTDKKKKVVVTTTTTSIQRRLYRPEQPNREDLTGAEIKVVSDVLGESTINLKNYPLKTGDRVAIVITNHYRNFPTTTTWNLAVRNTGWRTQQDATLLLIKRLNEPEGENVTESNFKPAPGTSFVFKLESRNRTWNFLNMGFGINGSFVDFQTDQNLEVGVGPVVSFFNGIIQFNYGWNLNATTDREYWSIGIGFLDIAGRVKELKTKKGD